MEPTPPVGSPMPKSKSPPSQKSPKKAAPSSSKGSPPKRRITIKSVAEQAGVSIATVSFVLNNRPGQVISEPVRKRVLEAARSLKYAPSAAAAGLARKQTANVAILFYRNDHLITNQLYSFVVQGAIKEASEREFNVLFSFAHDEYQSFEQLPKVVREKNAEGVLFIQDVSEPLFAELTGRGIAVTAVDSHPPVQDLDAIYVDNDAGARIACGHLLDLGHREVAFLRAAADRPSIAARSAAFQSELSRRGVRVKRPFIEASEITFQAGYAAALSALSERPELSGIACANDELAAGVIRAGHELGRRIPDDLSVVGFDDIHMARYLDPPLTTVRYDKEALGRKAMARLIERVQGREPAPDAPIGVELVVRLSTGPVRASAKVRPV